MTAVSMMLMTLVMAAVPAYLILQPYALFRLSGGWRVAAWVPLILTVPAAVVSAVSLAHDSNLWPITFIFAAPLCSLYLMVLLLLRRTRAPA